MDLFLTVPGFCCCAWAFSLVEASGGYSLVAVQEPLIAEASLVVSQGLKGTRALEVVVHGTRGMWDLPGPGTEPMPPALAGGFLTTGPPGKSPTVSVSANH